MIWSGAAYKVFQCPAHENVNECSNTAKCREFLSWYVVVPEEKLICEELGKDRQGRSCNHSCRRKAVSMKYYKDVSLFLPELSGVQTVSISSSILSIVVCLCASCSFTLPHKRWDFRNTNLLNIKCGF